MLKRALQSSLVVSFLFFLLLNSFIYLFIYSFNNKVEFNKYNYRVNSHHYTVDPRSIDKDFSFLSSLGQYDAQWYLKIAEVGYPSNPSKTNLKDKSVMDGLTYAFFPLYPLTLRTFNAIFKNIELSGFIFANFILILNFFSIYFVVKKFYSESLAIKTSFLLFFFPTSIFYRSYFAEGIFLFLLIWLSYFLISKKMYLSGIILGLLTVTKGNFLFIYPYFVYLVYKLYKKEKSFLYKFFFAILFSVFPLFLWLIFNYFKTGDPFYFIDIRKYWFPLGPIDTLLLDFKLIFYFSFLDIHGFRFSQLDIVFVFFFGAMLALSRRYLKKEMWWISFSLFITPLLLNSTMSFSRYQIVSFPIFIFLASRLNKKYFALTFVLFYSCLLLISLVFVNWYWIG